MPTDSFPATRQAALERVSAVLPGDYARSRNAIEGAVTGLSPYITHGLLSLPEVLAGVADKYKLDAQHKFVFELGWREYFRHVWAFRGEEIFESLREGLLPQTSYSALLPDDIRQAATGVPVIDMAVRTLYATGYLHNHARMWLASYVVHVRKVHWRAGADWLYAHLLDGDLASNHLSWQWVAGTGSSKPYLFNADNVARFAPEPWHSPGSVIDTSYEVLDAWARSPAAPPAAPLRDGIGEPPLLATPLEACAGQPLNHAGQHVQLQHPRAQGDPPPDVPENAVVLGLVLRDFHRRHPWSERRWQFVLQAWRSAGTRCWCVDAADLGPALAGAASVWLHDEPHLHPWRHVLPQQTRWWRTPPLFADVPAHQRSFSRWWQHTRLV